MSRTAIPHSPAGAPFEPSGFFVLRAPLLPFSEFADWAEGGADRLRLRERLLEKISQPGVLEAIFVASPDLHDSLETWKRAPDSERGQRVEQAVARYFARMCGRSTPFGLFAGCGTGTLGAETRLALGGRTAARRHTRLDMHYLDVLSQTLAGRPQVRSDLVHRPNSSLYRAGGRLRYARWEPHPVHRAYHLVTLAVDEPLEMALDLARAGIRPPALAASLARRLETVTEEEARAYVEDLIDAQVLLPDLSPPVTGSEEPLRDMVRDLGAAPDGAAAAAVLESAGAALRSLDAAGMGASASTYRSIGRELETLGAPIDLSRLFQVDLIHSTPAASLDPQVLKEIEGAIALLHRLCGGLHPDPLVGFRARFEERFGDAEVPLVEALDDEIGIGFRLPGNPEGDVPELLAGMVFPAHDPPHERWEDRHAWLLGRVEEAARSADLELRLGPEDIRRLERPQPPPLPDAFSVFASLAAASEEEVRRGEFRVLIRCVDGPSGARYFGRFCHADPLLRDQVESHLRAEEAHEPEAAYAEIVHLSEGRLGNIFARPLLRGHEIPYLGRSGAPAERQIPLGDLLVSVKGERVVLRSRRLGRPVVPCLTNAHHYSHLSLWIYGFLCSLGKQGVAGRLEWEWGPLETWAFLPRVASGRVILSAARWRLRRQEVEELVSLDSSGLLRRAEAWRSERRMPRFVMLKERDNLLPVDLQNVLSLEAMAGAVHRGEEAVLEEIYPPPDLLLARSPEGAHAHEIIVPFVRARVAAAHDRAPGAVGARASFSGPQVAGASAGAAPAEPRPASVVRRRAEPGSDWLYAKVYCGPLMADRLLREVIRPLVREARDGGAAQRWFFIRYADPHLHLRVRLQGDPAKLLGRTLPALRERLAPLLDSGTLWKLQLDTYEREVERYGGEAGIALAERIFEADSDAALEILEALGEEEPPRARWQAALCSIDRLLADLLPDAGERLALVRRVRDTYAREFHQDKGLRVQMGERFRREREDLGVLLGGSAADRTAAPPISSALGALERRSQRLRPIVAELAEREREGALSRPLPDLAAAFAHMTALRLLRSSPRPQELVLYDFLCRLHESRLARKRDPGGGSGRRPD